MPKGILVVDDSASIRHSLGRFLRSQHGFEVCGEAADGVEAIEKAQKLQPDLIVMDLAMPRMNGVDAAATLSSVLPNVPIILFTLHKEAVRSESARASGISAVVSKSDGVEALFREVQRLVGGAARSASG